MKLQMFISLIGEESDIDYDTETNDSQEPYFLFILQYECKQVHLFVFLKQCDLAIYKLPYVCISFTWILLQHPF